MEFYINIGVKKVKVNYKTYKLKELRYKCLYRILQYNKELSSYLYTLVPIRDEEGKVNGDNIICRIESDLFTWPLYYKTNVEYFEDANYVEANDIDKLTIELNNLAVHK